MTTYLLFAILAIILIILNILIFRSNRGKDDIILHNKLDSLQQEFTKRIFDSSQGVSDSLAKLYEKIGGLDKESRQILELTKSFHDILKPTKARGIVGESILENLLRDILPKEAIISQYTFKDGKRIDFVIKLPSGLVPVDAKFSNEVFKNYLDASQDQKDAKRRIFIDSIKKRITETSSYIYPDEGTVDFSLMYVPSEAVYYFIITETVLLEFAHQKKVFIVGPNTLYAYLRTIFVGFQALKIGKRAKQIYDNLKRLEKDMLVFIREHNILGSHIRSAYSKYEEVTKRAEKIAFKLSSIENDDSKSESSASG
ncbi:MAG: DNA recombination protein RmuC [Omnitrophica bacterium]|nr:DNA recombination protein RmuC [Candidatus Omnitrophota bacterium]